MTVKRIRNIYNRNYNMELNQRMTIPGMTPGVISERILGLIHTVSVSKALIVCSMNARGVDEKKWVRDKEDKERGKITLEKRRFLNALQLHPKTRL